MAFPLVLVASLEEADMWLKLDRQATTFPHVVSISHKKTQCRPSSLPDSRRNVLYLTFDDVTFNKPGVSAPLVDDIQLILQFARKNHQVPKILVHCQAGISRSSATSVIMHALWLGKGQEQQAMRTVARSVNRLIRPNGRMIQLADQLLDREGALVAAVEAFNNGVKWTGPDPDDTKLIW